MTKPGTRKDAYAEKYRIPVEEEKPTTEKGCYLHPDVYHQPETRSVEWAHRPELMKQIPEKEKLTSKE